MFNKIFAVCFIHQENVNFMTNYNNNGVNDIMNTNKNYVSSELILSNTGKIVIVTKTKMHVSWNKYVFIKLN